MLVIRQQIATDLQPHKKCSIIADSTYDSHEREATVFVTGESHAFGDLSVEGSSLRRVFSERELTFKFAICCRHSVCRLSVCNVGAPYSAG